ncbi:Urb2/Npa2 family-domain-containing protein [Mycena rosella]|uniref:Urb2/Npa2 family-domain-containing protein n=1 Tax=Mycena rosella TaxID=1033263 RepID=A0AAD7GVV6_MYCRO|nr:Urb2/Npa2 family-domain-containing protein [Mycena rosella]
MQAVYHALKAPSDPPQAGGPLKIQIAASAWDDRSLYMPNKGEVIAEWVLTKLLKDKAHPPPVLDPRFWSLLSDIVSNQPKSVRHWLLPLLNRVPIAPVVVSFLQLLGTVEVEKRVPLTALVNKSLTSIWPLAVHKISAETLLECFGTFIGVLEDISEPNDALEELGTALISSLRVSVGNSSNKKKLSSILIQNHLRKWIVMSSSHASSSLQERVCNVGIETIFNIETLRQVHNEDHPLFLTLKNIPDKLVQPMLPRIFSAFVQCTRKYRGALFGQSSGHNPTAVAEQVHAASFSFLDSCQVLLGVSNPTILTWEARLGLLTVVEEENLFSSIELDQTSLQNIVPLVLAVLESDGTGDRAEQASLSIACLSKLMQIDHDLILGDVPRILPKLLRIPVPFPSIFGFLESVLEYHVKTRTIHTHIEGLFASLARQEEMPTSDLQHQYGCSSSSALLHSMHLERLAKSTRKFLTSTQTRQTVKFILETLEACWNQILAITDNDSGSLALTFSFSARLASAILTALPLQALPDATLLQVTDLISEIRSKFLPRALSKTLKNIRKNAVDSWGSQVIAAAILRLEYALDTPYAEKQWAKIETTSEDGQLLPELSMEFYRILLKWSAVNEPTRTRGPLDRLLSYLENHSGASETSWSGASCSLTFGQRGKEESVLAILHMLIDRWLPTIDAIASAAQLQRLVRILVRTNVVNYAPVAPGLDETSLLLGALSSAQFWELPNVRTAILVFADEATSTLVDPPPSITAIDRAAASSTYQLLLMFPIEYISRTNRTELVRRAINADIIYSSLPDRDVYSAVTVIRAFIHNVSLHVGSVDQPIPNLSRYLDHLMHCNLASQAPQNYTAVSLNLVELHFSALLKSPEQESVRATRNLLRSCVSSNVLSSANESKILVRLVVLLTRGFSPNNFAQEIQDEISNLQQRLSAALVSHVEEIDVFFANVELMNLWLHTLSLGRWLKLKLTSDGMPLLGRKLCSWASNPSLPQPDQLDQNRTTSFAIIAEELQWLPDHDRLPQLGLVLATYVSLARLIGPDGQTRLDQLLSQTCNALSVTEFCYVMDLTCECLSDAAHSGQDMPHLVHIAALLLSEHPTNTLKHTQKFLTSCLNMFAARGEFTNGPLPLRLEVLRLLRQQCSDSPASLRTLDIGCIWSLLSKFLAKSKQHDDKTSTTVFHEITVTTGALIRLRRDLVALTLPNLALVLQQLIATIRQPRPQLGARQTALVTDSLPHWVNSACPVGPEEGKALARLLEALTTKTTIRTNSSTAAEAQRAESLARPFSKHAAYTIKAYIDAMNDPLCILPSELRKELRPGLFSLCNMLSDYSRDAMMVSALDAGGKTIMKSLWTEYEKQKYIGKG